MGEQGRPCQAPHSRDRPSTPQLQKPGMLVGGRRGKKKGRKQRRKRERQRGPERAWRWGGGIWRGGMNERMNEGAGARLGGWADGWSGGRAGCREGGAMPGGGCDRQGGGVHGRAGLTLPCSRTAWRTPASGAGGRAGSIVAGQAGAAQGSCGQAGEPSCRLPSSPWEAGGRGGESS